MSLLSSVEERERLTSSPSSVKKNSRISSARSNSVQSNSYQRNGHGSALSLQTDSLDRASVISGQQHALMLQSSNFDTDSIGSASSILYNNHHSKSRTSKHSSSVSAISIDPDDEILVGDEKDFHEACKCGDAETVEQLAKSGIDLNCRNKHDRTPLHWAAGNGHVEIIKSLLDEGAAIDLHDKFGMDALLWSAWFGKKACTVHLLRVGANSAARNKHGYTWLHCAAQNNHLSIVEILAEEMQEFDRTTVDDGGRSCLHIACKYGRSQIAKRLIELGCGVSLKDKSGNSALHVAAKHGFHEMVDLFVETKYDLDEVNSDQKTALHIAAEEGKDVFCKELLVNGADVNAETNDEMSSLHFAVQSGHAKTVQVILENGADIDAGNNHNQTPLHLAVVGRNFELIAMLINANAGTNIPDARNETVLHIAAENGLADISEILLLAGSDIAMPDEKGKTPLDVAARGNYVTIVDMMIKAERYRQAQLEDQTQGFHHNITFRADSRAATQHFRMLLYRLASKHLKTIEWKQLAFYWGFTDKHLQAIEEQYTGSKSYKEHGHRMLLIWFHGFSYSNEQNQIKELFEGLVGIQKKELAELMRFKSSQLEEDKNCCIS